MGKIILATPSVGVCGGTHISLKIVLVARNIRKVFNSVVAATLINDLELFKTSIIAASET